MSTQLGRVTAWVSRLSWRGILSGIRIGSVSRRSGASLLVLRWSQPDTEEPAEDWLIEVVVRLRDDEDEAAWNRRLLLALADAVGHELGEAVRLDGAALASPHETPRIWPWRPQDREGGEA